jgi:hypothetical protein
MLAIKKIGIIIFVLESRGIFWTENEDVPKEYDLQKFNPFWPKSESEQKDQLDEHI